MSLDNFAGACGTFARRNREFARRIGIIHPVIQAAPLERVVDLAGAVRGDDHDRRMRGAHRAVFRDRDLEIGEDFKQESLEGLVRAIEFVDQQDGRPCGVRLQRLQRARA